MAGPAEPSKAHWLIQRESRSTALSSHLSETSRSLKSLLSLDTVGSPVAVQVPLATAFQVALPVTSWITIASRRPQSADLERLKFHVTSSSDVEWRSCKCLPSPRSRPSSSKFRTSNGAAADAYQARGLGVWVMLHRYKPRDRFGGDMVSHHWPRGRVIATSESFHPTEVLDVPKWSNPRLRCVDTGRRFTLCSRRENICQRLTL
ncbi:hypothetical protein C8T65DRAFT_725246 [Cerioporus squamosus]|nr:hypothetical protein C8T65DRAFT_725246 [Cerioporus squamosus]